MAGARQTMAADWQTQIVRALDRGDPRVHGNGFIQLDGDDCRFHFWGDARIPRQKVPTPIHDHVFDMVSDCVRGAVHNAVYVAEPVVGYGSYKVYRAEPRHGSDTTLHDTGKRCDLRLVREQTVGTRQRYALPAGEFHMTTPLVPSITRMVRQKTYPNLAPLVLVPNGVEPDNEFDRHGHDTWMLRRIIREMIT